MRFLDVDGVTSTTFCFAHKIEGPSAMSFQVLRSEFDEFLLDHSIEEGAEVHEGTAVRSVDLEGPDGGVLVEVQDAEGQSHTVQARFLVDASGRDTFVANRMGTKTAHKELERTALSCHWSGCKYFGGLEEGMIQIVYTGGDKQGWIWVIPVGRDRLSIGIVMNTFYYRAQRAGLKDSGAEDWRHALYMREILESPYVAEVLANAAQMDYQLMLNGDYSYAVGQKWGERFALVGDASAFIDPIFSSGVYLAMQSSRYLSDAVDIRLREGVEAGAAAMEGVYTKVTGAYALVDKLIRLFYTPDAINFAQLGSASEVFDDYDHYASSMALQHFLLAGDFFEQAHKYSDFVDTLRDPRKFAMYENLVINRPTFEADSTCNVDLDVIFNPMLAVHEARRAELGI